jgi:SNF2 family DNA or RNA helicase
MKPTNKIKAFKHQLVSLEHAKLNPRVFDCSDPGTGKTFVSLVDAEHKIKHRQAKKVLVIAPKSLLRSVWYNDAKKFTPGLRVSVSTAGKHEKAFAEDADIYVTNTDAVKWLAKQPKSFFKGFDYLINDESSAFKHHTSQRSRAMAKIAKNFKYRRLMTGTPNSNGITDVWHQMFIVDEGQRLGKSFFAFRNTVCEPIQKGFNVNHVEWRDRPGAEDAVFGTIMDVVVRHKFEDCVDIPENHTYSLPYDMTSAQRTAYDKMQNEMIIEVYGSLEAVSLAKLKGVKPKVVGNITAIHAGSMQAKLLQIASGAVYESPEKYHVIDTGRYEMTLDLVQQREHSLVMFLWRHQRDLMIAEAEKRGVTFAVIDGTVPEHERDAIVKMYQAGRYQTVFAHPKSAGHGLTFTRGTATIWPSPTYDAELFTQGSKRQHRIGQTKKTETITLVAADSVEERVYSVLTDKRTSMSNFLDLLATAV